MNPLDKTADPSRRTAGPHARPAARDLSDPDRSPGLPLASRMTSHRLKPGFQSLLRPRCGHLARSGVTPNALTYSALLLSCAAGAVLAAFAPARWVLLLMPAVFALRMALNALDGMLAREHGMASPLGALLNEMVDVASDALCYLPFAFVPGLNAHLLVVVVVLAVCSELAGVVALTIGARRRYDGPMGKSDRALVLGGIALLLGLGLPTGPWLTWTLAVVATLLVLTILRRLSGALREAP